MIELNYGLFPEDGFDILPAEPLAKFILFESISRKNLAKEIERNPEKETSLKIQYVGSVNSAAEQSGLQLYNFDAASSVEKGFERFLASVNSAVTKIRLSGVDLKSTTSVNVPINVRDQIRAQIDGLRNIISKGGFTKEKEIALNKRLDELLEQLNYNRVSFGKVMSIIAYVSMGVHGATGFLADAPEAIATITSLIGASKEAEDEEILRIEGPITPKALPAPSTEAT